MNNLLRVKIDLESHKKRSDMRYRKFLKRALVLLPLVSMTLLLIFYWTGAAYRSTFIKSRLLCGCSDDSEKCIHCMLGIGDLELCAKQPRRLECVDIRKSCCEQIQAECKGENTTKYDAKNCQKYEDSFDCYNLSAECQAKRLEISEENFCQAHQSKNDCGGGKKGDIMVAIEITKCTGCTEFTAKVIEQYHNIYKRDIFVFHDHLISHNEHSLRNWYGNQVALRAARSPTIFHDMLETFLNKTDYKVMLLIDSDTVFVKNWRTIIEKHMIKSDVPFLSLYHSSVMHNFTKDCEIQVGDLCEGKIVGKFGVAISRKFAIMLYRSQNKKFPDWNTILTTHNTRKRYSTKSLVMRISQTNQDADNCGENEVPYRFNLCEFPQWIRNGIEFYFDRCTSPNESFSPDYSIPRADYEGRLWVRPAISYSFYGNKTRYTKGALENSRRVFSIYPGWKIWIYTDRSVPDDIMSSICEHNVRFIDKSISLIRNRMSWRFLIAEQPVKMYVIRDVDSRLIAREKSAVDEWIKSGRMFHTMRDHPNHSRFPLNGAMWGGRTPIHHMIEKLISANYNDAYMDDMYFLNNKIWPIVQKSVWAHDSHSLHKFGEDHPFPTKPKGNEFVGSVDFD